MNEDDIFYLLGDKDHNGNGEFRYKEALITFYEIT